VNDEYSTSREGSARGEISDELEIVLARRVNPKAVRELRLSFTKEEWGYLGDILRTAADRLDPDDFEEYISQLSPETKEAIQNLAREFEIPGPSLPPAPLI
jgi:hypothetical protein